MLRGKKQEFLLVVYSPWHKNFSNKDQANESNANFSQRKQVQNQVNSSKQS